MNKNNEKTNKRKVIIVMKDVLKVTTLMLVMVICMNLPMYVSAEDNEDEEDEIIFTFCWEKCDKCGEYKCICEKKEHEHNFVGQSCTEIGICYECYENIPKLGHDYSEATCTEPSKCRRCGDIKESEAGHDYSEATCTRPATCKKCGVTTGSELGHNYTESTCVKTAVCLNCGCVKDDYSPKHNYSEATCTSPATCKDCGAVNGEAKGHDYTKATCTSLATCKICGVTTGTKANHEYIEATCFDPAMCKRCGASVGQKLGHDFTTATCIDKPKCKRCGMVRNEVASHAYKYLGIHTENGSNYEDYVCTVCGEEKFKWNSYTEVETKKPQTTNNNSESNYYVEAEIISTNGQNVSDYIKTNTNSNVSNSINHNENIESNDVNSDVLSINVFSIVNEERSKTGLPTLSYAKSLQEDANRRARELATNYSHTRPDGSDWDTAYHSNAREEGENIAYTYGSDASEVMNMWMNSKGHRENILGNYTHMAVGTYVLNGITYWVQYFLR